MQNVFLHVTARPGVFRWLPRCTRWLAVGCLATAFIFVLVRTAWISDDAYITLRTVDNFVHGYGLTWNVVERVQSYTHPLWMFLLSAVYAVTHEAYFSTLALGAIVSLAALILLVRGLAASPAAAWLGGAGLVLSKAFVDYSTSGLENPLTHLLLALFFVIYLRPGAASRKLFLLSWLAALIAVNRIDALLLVAVPFLVALRSERVYLRSHWRKALGLMGLGFAPLIAWELFSLVYYGFLAPNTAYAKLNTGIPQAALFRQGLTYLLQSTRIDYFTSLMLGLGSLAVFWTRRGRHVAIVASALLYLAYVVWIGGDFMSGRFLAAPLFCVAAAFVSSVRLDRRGLAPAAFALMLLGGILYPTSPVWGDRFYSCGQAYSRTTGIDDERSCYFQQTGLVRQARGQGVMPNHLWITEGLKARSNALKVQLMRGVGFFGFAAGPETYVVDLYALGDPLLARLPVPREKPWRIGHFERLIPAGYLETLASGENRLCDRGLADYYDRLTTVLRGPLFTAERWRAIWKLNTGAYAALLEGYREPQELSQALCNAQGAVDVHFAAGPRLVGYSTRPRHAGGERLVDVTLYWQAAEAHENPLASFVHVRPVAEGQVANPRDPYGIWAQAEHYEPGGHWTTDYWRQHVYVDQFTLRLPPDIPPGEYGLEVGWFDPKAGQQVEPLTETMKPPLRVLWRSVLLPNVTF